METFPFPAATLGKTIHFCSTWLGLLGRGTKKNKGSVRLGNTDPQLVKRFVEFLKHFYDIQEGKFRFGLQIFSDMSSKEALNFWVNYLGVSAQTVYKSNQDSQLGASERMREKTKHGVLTVYVSNKKLGIC